MGGQRAHVIFNFNKLEEEQYPSILKLNVNLLRKKSHKTLENPVCSTNFFNVVRPTPLNKQFSRLNQFNSFNAT